MINKDNLMVIDSKTFETKYLGRILWYTVYEMKVDMATLEQAFLNAGIDPKYLPNPIGINDAFRRATKVAEANRIDLQDGRYLNLMVRTVKDKGDTLERHLVREIVDASNKRLEYTSIARMILDNDQYIAESMEQLNAYEFHALERVEKEFEDTKVNYNARHIREIIFNIIYSTNPVCMKETGSVYFVPEAHAQTVENLKELLNELSGYSVDKNNRSKLSSFPCIDAAEHRQDIVDSLEDQVKAKSSSLINEMARIIKDGRKIGEKAATQYINEVRSLKAMVKDYEEMLNTEIVSAQATMDIALQQAMKLLENVNAA